MTAEPDDNRDVLSELSAAHALLRHSNPVEVDSKLLELISLKPSLRDALFQTVDLPFKIINDPDNNEQFIGCEFNRDADSYRSPFTNFYEPELPDGRRPSDRLREMEILAQSALLQPNPLFPPKSINSIYCWNIDKNVFGFGLFTEMQLFLEKRKKRTIYGTLQRSHVVRVEKLRAEPKKSKSQPNKPPKYKLNLFSSGRLDVSVPLDERNDAAPQDTLVITVHDEVEDEYRDEVITLINHNYVDINETQDYIFIDGYSTYESKSRIVEAETDLDLLVHLFNFVEDENDNLIYSIRNDYGRQMMKTFKEYKKKRK